MRSQRGTVLSSTGTPNSNKKYRPPLWARADYLESVVDGCQGVVTRLDPTTPKTPRTDPPPTMTDPLALSKHKAAASRGETCMFVFDKRIPFSGSTLRLFTLVWSLLSLVLIVQAQTDPGVRGGAAGAGAAIGGLTVKEGKFFADGQSRFAEVDTVATGLGPRFNMNSCAGCHAQPASGGSSPATNPQVAIAPPGQFLNVNAFISSNGPVREVRFKSDGGVHDLYTIVGLSGTPAGCTISQPAFAAHLANDMIFRIPTPTFGAGLIEAITDATILSKVGISNPFGITGHENRNGNDGTLTRFGWKAQN